MNCGNDKMTRRSSDVGSKSISCGMINKSIDYTMYLVFSLFYCDSSLTTFEEKKAVQLNGIGQIEVERFREETIEGKKRRVEEEIEISFEECEVTE